LDVLAGGLATLGAKGNRQGEGELHRAVIEGIAIWSDVHFCPLGKAVTSY